MWAEDRIHMTTEGHRRVALAALAALGHATERDRLGDAAATRPRRSAAARPLQANAQWAREYVGPWVHRRLTGRSSGDAASAKRPNLLPPVPPQA